MGRERHVLKTVYTKDTQVVSGSGCRFKDSEGQEYLDFFGHANTLLVGYNNRDVLDPLRERLNDFVNVTTYMYNQDQLDAADLMAGILPGSLNYSAFYSSGSDAVETALKLAFRATDRRKVISHWGGYHGFSGYALAAGGSPFYRRSFEPMIPGFIHIPPPYLTQHTDADDLITNIENAFAYEGEESIAAVIVEPIVSNGVLIPPPGYLETMRRLCDESDAILIFDEIITGFGKTGKMFAFEHFGVEPDIIVTGKGISGSAIPAGAITVNERVMDMLGIPGGELKGEFMASGQHIVSYQNHPLVCVAVKANIEFIIKNNLVERSKELGAHLLSRLKEIEGKFKPLKRARGNGLQNAVEITLLDDPWMGDQKLSAMIAEKMYDKGVIIFGARRDPMGSYSSKFNHVRNLAAVGFAPPLVVTKDDIDQAMDVFEQTLNELVPLKK